MFFASHSLGCKPRVNAGWDGLVGEGCVVGKPGGPAGCRVVAKDGAFGSGWVGTKAGVNGGWNIVGGWVVMGGGWVGTNM